MKQHIDNIKAKLLSAKKNQRILIGIIIFLSTILLTSGGYFGFTKYIDYKNTKKVEEINQVLQTEFSKESCEKVLHFDEQSAEENQKFLAAKFYDYKNKCDTKYNFKNIELSLENCKNIIKGRGADYKKDYILLDSFSSIQEECSEKYLKITFGTGSFFDVNNDFKSSINLEFSLPFFEDVGALGSDEYIENRTNAKKRLISLLAISRAVKISVDDVVLYPKKGILHLGLEPLTRYNINLKSFENKGLETETKEQKFSFTTPENKFLGIMLENPVSLYMDTKVPEFEMVKYNLAHKKETTLKICRIDNETYAKIEILRGRKEVKNQMQDFFLKGIDDLQTLDCKEKKINLEGEKELLLRKKIDFSEEIGSPARSGLYFVTFADSEDRNINNNLQFPVFFGIVDSHITMKVSKNGEGYFFVNDFDGKPLAEQEIRVYVNKFVDHTAQYDRKKRGYDYTYNSPLKESVLGEEILLGKTGDDGVLRVDLQDKVEGAFQKTFSADWNYKYSGVNESFFITSASKTHLTYNHSHWNAGIAPWNFGYKIHSGWYGSSGADASTPTLSSRGQSEKEFYAHVYTDRVLYLPGEEVNMKSVIRQSKDLQIPQNKEFRFIVKDSKQKEIVNSRLQLSEYGSISDKLKLSKHAPLGTYTIILKDKNGEYARAYFSVEVFKNPKFKNEVSLEATGLNGEEVKITETKKDDRYYWRDISKGKFSIQARVNSKYYSGGVPKHAGYTYKVYKQYYWNNDYWDDCYWGCYWEPQKEFYTEGKGNLDEKGKADFTIDVAFESSYDDYKYIVEVTVTDAQGDKITGTNSVIARLPSDLKRWNSKAGLKFQTENNFYKQGEKVVITGGLSKGKWTSDYDEKYIFIIKKKNYKTNYIDDVRGYKRPVNVVEEKLEKIMFINSSNFRVTKNGKLELDFIPKEAGEYVFEYGKIHINSTQKISEITAITDISKTQNLLDSSKQYFTILSYGEKDAKNAIASDNKVRVLSQKVSYHLGETAKILIRLPFSKGKILWTVEKQGVIKKEYIDVNSNMFFKEVTVDDTFVPNAYIGVVAIEVDGEKIPEYKVGYTEIVVDKTDKKSYLELKTNKQIYKPREKVVLNISNALKNKDGKKAELTVMVVDDSLISLMGNVDLNTLEKFYKKLPFQVQTSLTNLAMLKNYYFSRPGIVGGSGFGNFKGGDAAVSSRTIFKNTAYYNPNVITDESGKATVEFELPDNLTNFRIMVASNSQDNFFGFGSQNIEVRKNVVIEDKTPLIYRAGDRTEIGAQIFNHTNNEIGFKIQFESKDISVNKPEKQLIVGPNSSQAITFWTSGNIDKDRDISYKILALGDSPENSDIIEKIIENKEFPALKRVEVQGGLAQLQEKQNFKIDVPENTDLEKSLVKISFSNNLLEGIGKTVSSLLVYPYGCIEQRTSSTYPNAIILKFAKQFPGIIDEKKAKENLQAGLDAIAQMQTADGGFGYWPGDTQSNLHITPYVLRRLVDMKEFGAEVPDGVIEKAGTYLEKNYKNITDNIDRTETFYALAKLGKGEQAYNALLKGVDKMKFSRHEWIAYTYGLIVWDKKENKEVIERNIERIKEKLGDEDNSYRYWSTKSDKALFTSLLLDYGASQNLAMTYIKELYGIDWSNYYYSTTAKNNAFIAFAKYQNTYGRDSASKFAFSIGAIHNRDKRFVLGEEEPNTIKREFRLKDIIQYKENHIELTSYVLSGKSIFTNLTLEVYPKDKLKIKQVANGMNVEREVFEVLDENKIEDCSATYYWKGADVNCDKVLRKVEDGVYKKGRLYKIGIKVSFDSQEERRNVALEDYFPSTFRVINSKFKTESSAIKKGNKKSWSWNHVEYLKDRVFANADRAWGNELYFEYMVTPDFKGSFVYPPVSAYMMYNGAIRAHGKFTNIEVK